MKTVIEYKLFENLQKAKKILADRRIPENNAEFLKLKELLSRNTGYIGQFTKWLFIDRTEFSQLEEIYKELKNINIDKPIDDFDKAEDLYDYIQSYEINKKTNQVINAIPSRTREFVDDKLRNLISLNIDVASSIKDFYSKKGGRFKSAKDLYNDTKGLIENLKGDFNADTIKNKLKGLNAEVAFESSEVLVIAVYDFKASCALGSKSWCISTSNSYWNQYVNEFTTQYFIFDFTKPVSDKRHMIGVTVSPNGSYHAAHYADDSRVTDYSIFDEL